METLVIVNGMTAHRANVIFARTGSAAMGGMVRPTPLRLPTRAR